MRYKKLMIQAMHLFLVVFILHLLLAQPASSQADGVRFTDVTTELGIEFQHANGESGQKYFIEPIGSGGCSFRF